MLTDRLRAALEIAERLPPEAQDALAAQIESVMRDALWNAVLNGPRPGEVLRQMTAEADSTGTQPFPTRAPTPRPPSREGKGE